EECGRKDPSLIKIQLHRVASIKRFSELTLQTLTVLIRHVDVPYDLMNWHFHLELPRIKSHLGASHSPFIVKVGPNLMVSDASFFAVHGQNRPGHQHGWAFL